MGFVVLVILTIGAAAWVLAPMMLGGDDARRLPGGGAKPGVPDTTGEDDRAEALVREWRGRVVSCPSCGTRPEPGAEFCSTCGRSLRGATRGPS